MVRRSPCSHVGSGNLVIPLDPPGERPAWRQTCRSGPACRRAGTGLQDNRVMELCYLLALAGGSYPCQIAGDDAAVPGALDGLPGLDQGGRLVGDGQGDCIRRP